MNEFFGWLNDQLLRMEWLSDLVAYLLAATGMEVVTPVGGSIHFFIYDVIKIFILLSVLIFAISWVQSYFPPERTRRILGGYSGIGANVIGALLGMELDHPLPTSLRSYSHPLGSKMPARCSFLVTGLRIGSPRPQLYRLFKVDKKHKP